MLYHVQMTVDLPHEMPPEVADEIKAREKAYAQDLQRQGVWRHLWRIAGSYANISIFDCRDNAHLQEVISNLPLFQYMDVEVRPLCRHPSSIHDDDR
jgi:muconolactone D-isomerase